jgi:hypothetical protein
MAGFRKIMFAGPTYAPVAVSRLAEATGFELRPPASRDDIAAVAVGAAGLIALVDGRFNQSLAVGHAELRRAIDSGWAVWGLSSMGAIRAFEMRHFGMRGFGRVYEHFLADGDFQDDEVALVHNPDEPYTCITEPLIHIRHCVSAMEKDGEIPRGTAIEIIDELKNMWFGTRSLETFFELVSWKLGPGGASAVSCRINNFDAFRIKTQDLVTFLQEAPWENGQYSARPTPAPYLH